MLDQSQDKLTAPQRLSSGRPCLYVSLFRRHSTVKTISLKERVAAELQSPFLGRNLQHSGNFPERTIGNSGNFSDCSPDHLTHFGRIVTVSLNFKSSYAYGCKHLFRSRKA